MDRPSTENIYSQIKTISQSGVVNAGPDQMTCVNGIVQIAGTVTGGANGGTWTASIPGGLFSPSNTSLNAYYTPPPGNTQPVTLTLTSNEPNPASDELVVTYGTLPPLILSASGPPSATCDETVMILIKAVSGFNDMSSLQYSVNWDPSKFSYVGNTSAAIGGASPSIGVFAVGMGKITYAWVDPSGSEGEDLADGTLLWTIKLKALNATGLTNVGISGNPTPVEATNAQFCLLTTNVQNDANINLIQIPVGILGNDTICSGQNTTLAANGGVSYIWNTGATTATITVSPVASTIYTVTATNGAGCTGSATKVVTVRPLPNAQISGNTAICGGIPTTLTASGGTSYVWSTAETTEAITVNPLTQTDYSVTVTNMGCTSSTAVVVTVNVAQTVSAGADQSTCVDGTTQLAGAVGSGAGGIWDDGGAGGSFSPDKTTLDAFYTPPSGNTDPITLTLSSNGPCPATDEMTVQYGTLPPLTLSAVGPDSVTCGDTILFMLRAVSGFVAIKSLMYSINWDQNKLMYLGDTATFIGGGAPVIDTQMTNSGQLIYNWADPAGFSGEDLPDSTVLLTIQLVVIANAGPAAVSVTNTPMVIGATNAQLCPITVDVQNSDSIALNPVVVSCPADQSVCANTPPITLSGASPDGGMYSGPGVTANMFDPALAPSGPNVVTYSAGVAGCSNSCTFTVTVNAVPAAAISVLENSGIPGDAAICPGSPVTLTGSGGAGYSWSTGASTGSIIVSPSETTIYILTVTDANACSDTAVQIITVIDSQAPTVVGNCPASSVEFCDLTVNDPQLWNEMYWWDGVISSHDLCEGLTDLNVTATDDISGTLITMDYLLFLDLDGNGTMETVISSANPPGANNINYDNAGNPNFSGGIPRAFDERPVPASQKYRFAIDRIKDGNNLKGYVRWDTADLPVNPDDTILDGVAPELPYGTHKIRWIMTDACGNQSVCEYTFIVKDCKPPTVECLSGVIADIPITGIVTLWATDFLQFAEDNCTPPTPYTLGNQLKFAVRKSGQGTGFPIDGAGNPIPSVTFTCNDIGTQPVELWAQDAAGNTAFCVTTVLIANPNFHCGSPIQVSGDIKTEPLGGMQGVEDAQIQLTCIPMNGAPAVNTFAFSDNSGAYLFSGGVPFDANCTLTPAKNDNPMNGVSTFDLVLISKHILGTDPLNSPYKMIAADANQSNSVTTFDILELRKLILGIYAELPNNSSWRFIDKNFTFADPLNPFSSIPFAENITLDSIQGNSVGDFTGIKIGDVNNSVIPNATSQGEERMAGTLLLNMQDRPVQAGETFDVTFSNTGIWTEEGETAAQVQGFQFTLNLDGLQVADIPANSQDKVSADNFGVFNYAPNGIGTAALTASIDGAAAFTVRFHAEKDGKLSRMLRLSNQITRTEAYDAAGRRLDVALRFGSSAGMTTSGVGFELYQNQPNPWTDRTRIGFHLPVSTSATLTVYDETGRVLFTQKGDYAKGYNAVSLDRIVLNTPGVLYYKLETATDAATMKMIQIK